MCINLASKGGENDADWGSDSVALKKRPANAVANRFANRLIAQTAANR